MDARANASGAGGDGSSLRAFYTKNQMQHYLAHTINTTEYLDCLRALIGAHWADSFPAELDAVKKSLDKVPLAFFVRVDSFSARPRADLCVCAAVHHPA